MRYQCNVWLASWLICLVRLNLILFYSIPFCFSFPFRLRLPLSLSFCFFLHGPVDWLLLFWFSLFLSLFFCIFVHCENDVDDCGESAPNVFVYTPNRCKHTHRHNIRLCINTHAWLADENWESERIKYSKKETTKQQQQQQQQRWRRQWRRRWRRQQQHQFRWEQTLCFQTKMKIERVNVCVYESIVLMSIFYLWFVECDLLSTVAVVVAVCSFTV